MSKKYQNPMLSFYSQHNISPVHQDISSFTSHMMRREKLYRQLGLPPVAFSKKLVLEVGPGGGYNALAMFVWGANIHFVEPNPIAQQQLPDLLGKYGVERHRWKLFKQTIEIFEASEKYDIVLAEGFIPSITNQREVIEKISTLVDPGGVVVVTCMDDISFFLELLKRLVAIRLLKVGSVERFDAKVHVLANAFSSHLQKLQYASRPVEDWVADQFLNPALYGDLFSIADCLNMFNDEFSFLGSSPSLFTDYSWYKDTDHNETAALLEQFQKKRHALIHYDLSESERDAAANIKLADNIHEFRMYASKVESSFSCQEVESIISRLRRIKELSSDIDPRIPKAIDEGIQLLKNENLDEKAVSEADHLAEAFGRGQQYVSLVRRFAPS